VQHVEASETRFLLEIDDENLNEAVVRMLRSKSNI